MKRLYARGFHPPHGFHGAAGPTGWFRPKVNCYFDSMRMPWKLRYTNVPEIRKNAAPTSSVPTDLMAETTIAVSTITFRMRRPYSQ